MHEAAGGTDAQGDKPERRRSYKPHCRYLALTCIIATSPSLLSSPSIHHALLAFLTPRPPCSSHLVQERTALSPPSIPLPSRSSHLVQERTALSPPSIPLPPCSSHLVQERTASVQGISGVDRGCICLGGLHEWENVKEERQRGELGCMNNEQRGCVCSCLCWL